MIEIVNIITDNLVWILVGIVVILLAIIGRYADKTNFGEGKKIIKIKKKKGKKSIIEELAITESEESKQEKIKEDVKEKNNVIDNNMNTQNEKNNTNDNLNSNEKNDDNEKHEDVIDSKEENNKRNEEIGLDEFNDLDALLPKKEIVTGEFLQEVEDMNLDFKKGNLFSKIPDLDDVELPDIKKKNTKTDIWG